MALLHEEVSEKILAAAIEVHRTFGPGLLESTYEACLCQELQARGIRVERQVALPVIYKGTPIDCAYRMDLVVEGKVVVEVKAVEKVAPIHEAQLMTYLRLSGIRVGLIINFNVSKLMSGVVRRAV